jgi:dolichol kinase
VTLWTRGVALGDAGAGEPVSSGEAYRRQAARYFRASLWLTGVLTAVWLFLVVTGRDAGPAFKGYQLNREAVVRVAFGMGFMIVLWGWLWYGVKLLMLRKLAGFSREEARTTFRSRMREPFDLHALLARHSERRIRIADMIGRRGRFMMIGLLGYGYVYTRVASSPTPEFLFLGLQEFLFDAIVYSWLMLVFYDSDGFLGRVAYGAQARIMDGTLGRANCLVITMLWSLFKFFMVPLGFQLAAVYPPATYATLFAFVWLSYLTGDGLSEIVGQLFGKQKLRVWGIGEVNRKSIAGTWACLLGSLAICLSFVYANGLGPAWIALAIAIAFSNTLLELFSPRGTDDFTMASANALICWAFGAWVL